jgi:hypothetical protein
MSQPVAEWYIDGGARNRLVRYGIDAAEIGRRGMAIELQRTHIEQLVARIEASTEELKTRPALLDAIGEVAEALDVVRTPRQMLKPGEMPKRIVVTTACAFDAHASGVLRFPAGYETSDPSIIAQLMSVGAAYEVLA